MVPLQIGHICKRKNLLKLRRLLQGFPYLFYEIIEKTENWIFFFYGEVPVNL